MRSVCGAGGQGGRSGLLSPSLPARAQRHGGTSVAPPAVVVAVEEGEQHAPPLSSTRAVYPWGTALALSSLKAAALPCAIQHVRRLPRMTKPQRRRESKRTARHAPRCAHSSKHLCLPPRRAASLHAAQPDSARLRSATLTSADTASE